LIQSRSTKFFAHYNEIGCKVTVQITNHGGADSTFKRNGERRSKLNGEELPLTAYSWRDTTTVAVLDCFYDTTEHADAHKFALDWTAENERASFGPDGCFADTPYERSHRMLWASHGDRNMGNVWQHYYTPEQYKRLCAIKQKEDSAPLFSANTFVVGAKAGLERFPPNSDPEKQSLEFPHPHLFPLSNILEGVASKALDHFKLGNLIHLGIDKFGELFDGLLRLSKTTPQAAPAAKSGAALDMIMSELIKERERPILQRLIAEPSDSASPDKKRTRMDKTN